MSDSKPKYQQYKNTIAMETIDISDFETIQGSPIIEPVLRVNKHTRAPSNTPILKPQEDQKEYDLDIAFMKEIRCPSQTGGSLSKLAHEVGESVLEPVREAKRYEQMSHKESVDHCLFVLLNHGYQVTYDDCKVTYDKTTGKLNYLAQNRQCIEN